MAVTIGWNEEIGDVDLRTGHLKLLKGPSATRQNILLANQIPRGVWFGNVKTVGFPVDAFLITGTILAGNGTSGSLSTLAPMIRNFLRSSDGLTGVRGVIRVLTNPEIRIDEDTKTIHYSVSVLDETSQPIIAEGDVSLTGEGSL